MSVAIVGQLFAILGVRRGPNCRWLCAKTHFRNSAFVRLAPEINRDALGSTRKPRIVVSVVRRVENGISSFESFPLFFFLENYRYIF